MEERLLANIDADNFMRESGWNFTRDWQGKIDVSAWLRTQLELGGRLYLFVVYHDGQSRRALPVDRCLVATSESILLSGRIAISGAGPIKSFQVKAKFAGCRAGALHIEDVTLKASSIATRRFQRAV